MVFSVESNEPHQKTTTLKRPMDKYLSEGRSKTQRKLRLKWKFPISQLWLSVEEERGQKERWGQALSSKCRKSDTDPTWKRVPNFCQVEA